MKSGLLCAAAAVFVLLAEPAAADSYYSGWLTPQLYGAMVQWPSSVADAPHAEASLAEFSHKVDIAGARSQADFDMNMAALRPVQDKDDGTRQGVTAWLALIDTHDSSDADVDRLEALGAEGLKAVASFRAEHDHLTVPLAGHFAAGNTCTADFTRARALTEQNYAVAEHENETLKGIYNRMQGVLVSIVRREERWATVFKGLSPQRQLYNYGTMHDIQRVTLAQIWWVSGFMKNNLPTQIEPWLDARQRMLADHRTCN